MSTVEQKYILAVKITPCNRVYYYESDEPVKVGEKVVVETMFGIRVGEVVALVSEIESEKREDLSPIIRKATEEDIKKEQDNRVLEEEAFQFCLERIKARGLPMKLVRTEAMLDRRRIVFYFTAEGRVDFRELVRDLAAKFRTRIEMRQIGVRDEAKILGGLGICGRVTCCSYFLQNFAPISIRMAKEQELVLNTAKLTGLCGRLMCCLSYEYEGTIEGEDEMPIETEDGTICEQCYEESSKWKWTEQDQESVSSDIDEYEESITQENYQQESAQKESSELDDKDTLLERSIKDGTLSEESVNNTTESKTNEPAQKRIQHKRDKHLKQKARRKRHKRKKKKRR